MGHGWHNHRISVRTIGSQLVGTVLSALIDDLAYPLIDFYHNVTSASQNGANIKVSTKAPEPKPMRDREGAEVAKHSPRLRVISANVFTIQSCTLANDNESRLS